MTKWGNILRRGSEGGVFLHHNSSGDSALAIMCGPHRLRAGIV